MVILTDYPLFEHPCLGGISNSNFGFAVALRLLMEADFA